VEPFAPRVNKQRDEIMKKIVLLALAASTVAVATPAFAQNATGTVNITGTVGDKCQVTPGAGGNYVTSRDLLELSQADGMLEASSTLATRFGVAGSTAPTFRVVCTTAAPNVSVNASPLLHGTVGLQAPAEGYTGTINYTAGVKVSTVAGTENISDTTAAGSTDLTLASRLAASGNNLEITTSAFNTAASALLNAGSYSGQIVVTVSPN
jgi:hypothetical protein